jgi:hypothetical protein
MDNAVTVPLKLVAVGMWRLGIPAPAGLSRRESKPAEAQFHFLLLGQFSENRKGNAADSAGLRTQGFEELSRLVRPGAG